MSKRLDIFWMYVNAWLEQLDEYSDALDDANETHKYNPDDIKLLGERATGARVELEEFVEGL